MREIRRYHGPNDVKEFGGELGVWEMIVTFWEGSRAQPALALRGQSEKGFTLGKKPSLSTQ